MLISTTYTITVNITPNNRCFGCQVIEGYGMTETSCVISIMDEGDTLSGHVGSPSSACGKFLSNGIEIN